MLAAAHRGWWMPCGVRPEPPLPSSIYLPQPLRRQRSRLADAARVRWIVADVTAWTPDRQYDLWHDRAAFHFLTTVADQQAYVRVLAQALRDGGKAVIGTFAPDGPEKCSGLPVARYDARKPAGRSRRTVQARRDAAASTHNAVGISAEIPVQHVREGRKRERPLAHVRRGAACGAEAVIWPVKISFRVGLAHHPRQPADTTSWLALDEDRDIAGLSGAAPWHRVNDVPDDLLGDARLRTGIRFEISSDRSR